jgi:hypothetical protein
MADVLTEPSAPDTGNAESLANIFSGGKGTTEGTVKPEQGDKTSAESDTGLKLAPWADQLPDEIKEDPQMAKRLAKFQKIGDMAKAYLEIEGKQSEGIVPPGSDAKPEEISQFWEKIGKPKESGQYSIAKDKNTAEFIKLAHEANLTDEQAKVLYKGSQRQLEHSRQLIIEARQKEMQETERKLRDEFGARYSEKYGYLQRGLKSAGSNIINTLERAGIAGNIDIIRMLITVGELTSESGGAKGTSTSLPKTKSILEGGSFTYK